MSGDQNVLLLTPTGRQRPALTSQPTSPVNVPHAFTDAYTKLSVLGTIAMKPGSCGMPLFGIEFVVVDPVVRNYLFPCIGVTCILFLL